MKNNKEESNEYESNEQIIENNVKKRRKLKDFLNS